MKTGQNVPATKGDVHVNHGQNGGVISTTIVTDDNARGRVPGLPGYECRDATPAEIEKASNEGRVKHIGY